MSEAKGKTDPVQGAPPPPTLASRIVAFYKTLPGGALLFAVVPLLVLGYFGWYYWGAAHLDKTLYSLKLSNLAVTNQPTWIRTDVREEVYRNGSLSHVSLLDPQATATIAHAFAAHTWVQHTSRVQKMGNGKVKVDLIYREPAAMVYFKSSPRYSAEDHDASNLPREGFCPIDREGIILPIEDFVKEQVREYFRIYAEGASPAGDVGMPFGDSRIADALELCRLLAPKRTILGLERIYVTSDAEVGTRSPWSLMLVTKDNREIEWGHAPGKESNGEPTVEDKFARLEKWLTATNSTNSTSSMRLNLRTRQSPANRLTGSN